MNLPKYAKDDVFGLMFFVMNEYRHRMLGGLDNLIALTRSDVIKNYYNNYQTCARGNVDFDVIAEIPEDVKNEMILYWAKHTIRLSEENFTHYMNKYAFLRDMLEEEL